MKIRTSPLWILSLFCILLLLFCACTPPVPDTPDPGPQNDQHQSQNQQDVQKDNDGSGDSQNTETGIKLPRVQDEGSLLNAAFLQDPNLKTLPIYSKAIYTSERSASDVNAAIYSHLKVLFGVPSQDHADSLVQKLNNFLTAAELLPTGNSASFGTFSGLASYRDPQNMTGPQPIYMASPDAIYYRNPSTPATEIDLINELKQDPVVATALEELQFKNPVLLRSPKYSDPDSISSDFRDTVCFTIFEPGNNAAETLFNYNFRSLKIFQTPWRLHIEYHNAVPQSIGEYPLIPYAEAAETAAQMAGTSVSSIAGVTIEYLQEKYYVHWVPHYRFLINETAYYVPAVAHDLERIVTVADPNYGDEEFLFTYAEGKTVPIKNTDHPALDARQTASITSQKLPIYDYSDNPLQQGGIPDPEPLTEAEITALEADARAFWSLTKYPIPEWLKPDLNRIGNRGIVFVTDAFEYFCYRDGGLRINTVQEFHTQGEIFAFLEDSSIIPAACDRLAIDSPLFIRSKSFWAGSVISTYFRLFDAGDDFEETIYNSNFTGLSVSWSGQDPTDCVYSRTISISIFSESERSIRGYYEIIPFEEAYAKFCSVCPNDVKDLQSVTLEPIDSGWNFYNYSVLQYKFRYEQSFYQTPAVRYETTDDAQTLLPPKN
ncbi:MAG: hypothetical protein E7223_02055 [Clostridiales bacterium]|nr:hypothetical protein [Clostridiales bacterium]